MGETAVGRKTDGARRRLWLSEIPNWPEKIITFFCFFSFFPVFFLGGVQWDSKLAWKDHHIFLIFFICFSPGGVQWDCKLAWKDHPIFLLIFYFCFFSPWWCAVRFQIGLKRSSHFFLNFFFYFFLSVVCSKIPNWPEKIPAFFSRCSLWLSEVANWPENIRFFCLFIFFFFFLEQPLIERGCKLAWPVSHICICCFSFSSYFLIFFFFHRIFFLFSWPVSHICICCFFSLSFIAFFTYFLFLLFFRCSLWPVSHIYICCWTILAELSWTE